MPCYGNHLRPEWQHDSCPQVHNFNRALAAVRGMQLLPVPLPSHFKHWSTGPPAGFLTKLPTNSSALSSIPSSSHSARRKPGPLQPLNSLTHLDARRWGTARAALVSRPCTTFHTPLVPHAPAIL